MLREPSLLACYDYLMSTATLHELQRDPLGILARVEAGESIVVTRDDQPVAELRPIRSAPRPFGLAAGAFVVPPGFDEPLPDDILREFEGR